MHCLKCGKEINKDAKFCFSCGAEININLVNSGKGERKKEKIKKEGGQKPKRYGAWFFVAIIFSPLLVFLGVSAQHFLLQFL